MITPEEIFKAFVKCKPAPAYLECHPKDLFDMLGNAEFYDVLSRNYWNGKFADVEVRTHRLLKGWRVVARPYNIRDIDPDQFTEAYTPRSPIHVQSDDFDDIERNEYERRRIEYEKRVGFVRCY